MRNTPTPETPQRTPAADSARPEEPALKSAETTTGVCATCAEPHGWCEHAFSDWLKEGGRA